jgi:hypothetical protein
MPPLLALLIQGEDDTVVHPVNQQQLACHWLYLNGLPSRPPSAPLLGRHHSGRGRRGDAGVFSAACLSEQAANAQAHSNVARR